MSGAEAAAAAARLRLAAEVADVAGRLLGADAAGGRLRAVLRAARPELW